MPHPDFTLEELVASESFQNWVLQRVVTDEQYWNDLLTRYPHQKFIMEEAARQVKQLATLQNPPLHAARKERTIEQVLVQIRRLEQEKVSAADVDRFRLTRYRWFRFAAVLAAFGVLGLVVLRMWPGKQLTYSTQPGETRTIALPDGTEVMLNANSRLTLAQAWNARTARNVWLEGEAFFKVTKQGTEGNALFIVHTADLEVHVLGTRFNVQQRSAQTKVSLNEGNVRLLLPQAKSLSRAKPQAITMKPGELVAFSQQDRRIVRKRVDPTLYSAWTSRKYIFRNTPLREIIATLEQNYGVDVVVKDSAMLRQSLSGTVVSDDLPTLLKALSATADLDIQQNGKQILFQRKE